MQGIPRISWRPRLSTFPSLLALATATLIQSAAAGLNFQVPFYIRGEGIVTNRSFNTVTGPADGARLLTGMRLVPSGTEGVYIGIDRSTVLRVNANGQSVNESENKPELADWSMGVTFDSEGQRVVLVTLGGEGFLYQRTPGGEWSQIASMENEDLESLVYRAADNSFYGIEVYNGSNLAHARLLKYSGSGQKVGEVSLPPFPVNLAPGDHTAKLVAVEGKIVALVERDPDQPLQYDDHSRIYVIDPVSGSAELTFDEVAHPNGHLPNVNFVMPTNVFSADKTYTLSFDVSDEDNDLASIEAFDGETSLKRWTYDQPFGSQVTRLSFDWTPTTAGTHLISVHVKDSRGNLREDGLSVPVSRSTSSFVGWYFKTREVVGVDYTQDGPSDGGTLFRGLFVAQAGYRYLGRDLHTIFRWDNERDVYTETSPGGDFSWPRGTAFDSKRNRFLVVTLVGDGTLYAVTPATLEWSTIASMNNVDVDSIEYNLGDDRIYMVENHGGTVKILRYTAEGAPDGSISIPDVPLEVGSYYASRLISNGNKLALLIEPTPGWTPRLPAESRIYIVDPVANTFELTYRKQWENWPPTDNPPPPPPPAPTIAITSPTNMMQFAQGKPIPINARGNSAFANVSIFADGQKIGDAKEAAITIYPPSYGLAWSNAPAGEHTLLAVGTTGRNTSATSAPVRIRVVATSPIATVTRNLPDNYTAGTWINVQLVAKVNSLVTAWAIEETPPSDWTFGQASHEGVFDKATGKIKWGPFTDGVLEKTIIYTIRPGTNSTGLKRFSGVVSVNGVTQAIVGDTIITDTPGYHPADAPPQDRRLTVNEVTAYASAWKTHATWPRGPSPIPINYVTRAGQIWKSGEQYTFNPVITPPSCWIPLAQKAPANGIIAFATTANSATRTLPPAFTPGRVTTVSVNVRPAAGVQNYAIEEKPPAGWTIVDADGATASGGTLRYGPFYDSQERTFVYHLVPDGNAAGQFTGQASFDGSKDDIEGAASLTPPTTVVENHDGHVYLRFNATPGEQFILESADAIDSAAWHFESTIQGADSAIDLPPIVPAGTQKFYRLRPAQ